MSALADDDQVRGERLARVFRGQPVGWLDAEQQAERPLPVWGLLTDADKGAREVVAVAPAAQLGEDVRVRAGVVVIPGVWH